MQSRPTAGTNGRGMIVILAVLAVLAAIAAAHLGHEASSASAAKEEALSRCREDALLAGAVGRMRAEALKTSADLDEARSSGWLEAALKRRGIAVTTIKSADPTEAASGLERIETTINFDNAALESTIGFLREVESGRPNLRLVEATLTRNEERDSWNVTLKYAAVIRARSRT